MTINDTDESGVSFVALVDDPATQRNWMAFNSEGFVSPDKGEHESDFMKRCIPYVINEGKDNSQAVAICSSIWSEHFASEKISFDYDETLSTERGKELAKKAIESGATVYIISARDSKDSMLSTAKDLGIPENRVFATGSNGNKITKIKELGITKHYDNNSDVIKSLGTVGQKFNFFNFKIQNEERRIITGALMVADLPIYRFNESIGEFYVTFDKPTIEKIVQKFFKYGNTSNVNKMHNPDMQVDGVYMFESFIIDSERGIKVPDGFDGITEGSWFGSYKIDNEDVWQNFIKTGEFKGFSVEGLFDMEIEKKTVEQDIIDLIDEISNIKV